MKIHAINLIVLGFAALLSPTQAEEYKPGPAHPKNRQTSENLQQGSSMSRRISVPDWTLVVLIRGEQHFILNKKKNRYLAEKPAELDDIVIIDDAATSFLGWRKQNPEAKMSTFWETNPQLLKLALKYSLAPSVGSSSSPSDDFRKNGKTRMDDVGQVTHVPQAQPLPKTGLKSKLGTSEAAPVMPDNETASSEFWGVAVILIMGATGLLWWHKRRK